MEIAWIESFLAVVDHHGFSRAADVLHRSQPSISSHITAMERELGARLLDRRRRPVALTDAGEAFAIHARAILREIEEGRSSVAAVTGLHRGTVRFGSYASASAGFLPAVLERFTRRYPGITFVLLESGTIELEEALVKELVDLIVRPLGSPFEVDGLRTRPLWREPLDVVLPDGHPLAAEPTPVPAAALATERLITTGRRRPGHAPSDHFWPESGLRQRVVCEATHPQTMAALVRIGYGVGITNRLALSICDTSGLTVRPLAGPDAVRDVAVHWLEHRPLPAAARAFLNVLTATPLPHDLQPLPVDPPVG